MKKSSSHFMIDGVAELLQRVGENIKIARVRRQRWIRKFEQHL